MIAKKHTVAPPTSDRVDRTSFSSIKENNTGVAQSFTDSKTSSYLRHEYSQNGSEDAILDDATSSGCVTPVLERKPGLEREFAMLNPQSALHGFVCPCDGFRGWKGISIGGKTASKSIGDLRSLAMRWEWDSGIKEKNSKISHEGAAKKVGGKYPPGQSPLERLPTELLGSIIDQLATDIPPNGFTARNIDLMSMLLTSRGVHSATLATLYSQVTIPHSRIFRKFLSHITEYPSLGTIVRRLDFSHFNPTGAGMSKRERQETLNLIPETLRQCLDLTPNLREFLAQEHIDDDLDSKVIYKLLCDLPKLKALDLCACSSTSFKSAFMSVLETVPTPLPTALPITRLSLHECTILPSTAFSTLLPRLPHLTHLDVAHTRITPAALFSIPTTARLTHLNLSKCASLTGESIVSFLTTHPAAKTLVYLNLGMDFKSHDMLSADDLTALIPHLPGTLRSLNLKGSKMDASHIPLLFPFTKHLEELGLGRHLELRDVERFFVPDENAEVEEQLQWVPHSLHYVDVSDLSVQQLDLGTLFGMHCPLLQSVSSPLEVLELSAEVNKKLSNSKAAMKRVGWCLQEAGRRSWLVREKGVGDREGRKDEGAREWKWGANYWGMRKIPVGRAEVGGMYGHYMFKR